MHATYALYTYMPAPTPASAPMPMPALMHAPVTYTYTCACAYTCTYTYSYSSGVRASPYLDNLLLYRRRYQLPTLLLLTFTPLLFED